MPLTQDEKDSINAKGTVWIGHYIRDRIAILDLKTFGDWRKVAESSSLSMAITERLQELQGTLPNDDTPIEEVVKSLLF